MTFDEKIPGLIAAIHTLRATSYSLSDCQEMKFLWVFSLLNFLLLSAHTQFELADSRLQQKGEQLEVISWRWNQKFMQKCLCHTDERKVMEIEYFYFLSDEFFPENEDRWKQEESWSVVGWLSLFPELTAAHASSRYYHRK